MVSSLAGFFTRIMQRWLPDTFLLAVLLTFLVLLGIAGLRLRDIMGYCTVVLLWSGLVISAGIYFLF